MQQVARRAVDDAVHRTQQRRPRLVVEDDDDTGVRELLHVDVLLPLTPATGEFITIRDGYE